ncbi:hypothetical protein [Sphingobium yanoikuyae]|uniref:hypothetical protein n=1 Tax=Sphingobium yanoikuyae TaxID=13690 RepID=UPI0022DD5EEF|nr:hypothetical protein [Sphingobium yanoikuyae]WBQ17853.1 hypothetical protein PAE53_06530 [Sphingobium yanoikuyae]
MLNYQALSHGPIQVQRTLSVEVEGETLRSTKIYVLTPGDDLTGQPEEIQQACNAWWTPERMAAWQAEVERIEREMSIA